MTEFFEENHLACGNTPGGKFTGKVLREIMSPEKLEILSGKLGARGNIYIKFLAALRELYSHCARKDLEESSITEKAMVFRHWFEEVHKDCQLSDTVKVHILSSHCSQFISWNGHTMGLFMDESIEKCHGQLRHLERTHNYVCKKKKVGDEKSRRSKASFDMWNSKNLHLSKTKAVKKTKRYF